VEITSQNHSFAIDLILAGAEVEITHLNLNDRTVAGLRQISPYVLSAASPRGGPVLTMPTTCLSSLSRRCDARGVSQGQGSGDSPHYSLTNTEDRRQETGEENFLSSLPISPLPNLPLPLYADGCRQCLKKEFILEPRLEDDAARRVLR